MSRRDPHYNITVVTPPVNEPITLTEAKSHLRVLASDNDTYINTLIGYARDLAEERMDRALINQTLRAKYDFFPIGAPLKIHRSPLGTVSSVKYIDTSGDEQTWDSSKYQFDGSEPARLLPVPGEAFPATQVGRLQPVEVNYTAGYGADSTFVPEKIRRALLMLIGHGWINREEVTTGFPPKRMIEAADSIFFGNKIWTLS